jgi:hypothetical protein
MSLSQHRCWGRANGYKIVSDSDGRKRLVRLTYGGVTRFRLSLFWGPLFISVGRKQQHTDGVSRADDFAPSKVSDSLQIGFLGSVETRYNSEEMRGCRPRISKARLRRAVSFLLHTAQPPPRPEAYLHGNCESLLRAATTTTPAGHSRGYGAQVLRPGVTPVLTHTLSRY